MQISTRISNSASQPRVTASGANNRGLPAAAGRQRITWVTVVAAVSAALRRIHEQKEQKETKKTKIVRLVELPPIHDSRFTIHQRARNAFTLIELLVVIIMIAILAGLLFPALIGAQNQAKKVQAKNDLTQIVSAVNAFYTEYGKYPFSSTATTKTYSYNGQTYSYVDFDEGGNNSNDKLFDVLQNNTGSATNGTSGTNLVGTLNPRGIVFIQIPSAKNQTSPRAGIFTGTTNAAQGLYNGVWYDPWGPVAGKTGSGVYHTRIDASYANDVANPYGAPATGGAGSNPLSLGAIAWSFGSDQKLGTNGDNVYRTSGGAQSDDVISWQ